MLRITFKDAFYAKLKQSDELAVRATIDVLLTYLGKRIPQKSFIDPDQEDELNKIGTTQFAQHASLKAEASQAIQWMVLGIKMGPTPNIEKCLTIMDTTIRHLRTQP